MIRFHVKQQAKQRQEQQATSGTKGSHVLCSRYHIRMDDSPNREWVYFAYKKGKKQPQDTMEILTEARKALHHRDNNYTGSRADPAEILGGRGIFGAPFYLRTRNEIKNNLSLRT